MDEHSPTAPEGEFIIEHKYLIYGDILGKGAWSVVKCCKPINNYQPPKPIQDFVVKIIEKQHLIKLSKGDEKQAENEIMREIYTLSHLPVHDNIAIFVEFIQTDEYYFLIFEAAPYGDLCDKILNDAMGKLPEYVAQNYMSQIIKAVISCHKVGIAHRDIKPENILLGNGGKLKLSDFGLAKCIPKFKKDTNANKDTYPSSLENNEFIKDTQAIQLIISDAAQLIQDYESGSLEYISCKEVVGTPYYGAPEMFYAKCQNVCYDGFLADAWSLGVVAFIMMTGTFPFSPPKKAANKLIYDSLMSSNLNFPENFPKLAQDFIKKFLIKNPSNRMKVSEALNHEWLQVNVIQQDITELTAVELNFDDITLHSKLVNQHVMRLMRRHLILIRCKSTNVEPVRATSVNKSHIPSTKRGSSVVMKPKPHIGKVMNIVNASITPNSCKVTPNTRKAGSIPITKRFMTPNMNTKIKIPLKMKKTNVNGVDHMARTTPVHRGTTPKFQEKPVATPKQVERRPIVKTPIALRNNTPLKSSLKPKIIVKVGTKATASSAVTTNVKAPLLKANLKSFVVGSHVLYKNKMAVIKFKGRTGFAPGIWLGLEMKEGNEGLHNGTSQIDNIRYFDCKQGKGVFVREAQITHIS